MVAAQAPPGPTLRLQIANLPPGPNVWDADSENNLGPFQVELVGEQIVCPPATTVTVTVTAATGATGVTLNVTPATLTYTLSGPYTAANRLSMSQDASIAVSVAADAPEANTTIDVTATAGGAVCQPATTPAPAAASSNLTVIPVEAEGPGEEPDGDDDAPPSNNTTKKKKDGGIPAVESPLVAVTFALAAFLVARRRRA